MIRGKIHGRHSTTGHGVSQRQLTSWTDRIYYGPVLSSSPLLLPRRLAQSAQPVLTQGPNLNISRKQTDMDNSTIDALFTTAALQQLFPEERTNDFFEALFGDANDGAYDISLGYGGYANGRIRLELRLHE